MTDFLLNFSCLVMVSRGLPITLVIFLKFFVKNSCFNLQLSGWEPTTYRYTNHALHHRRCNLWHHQKLWDSFRYGSYVCAAEFVTDAPDGVEQTEFKCINITVEHQQPAIQPASQCVCLCIHVTYWQGAVWQNRFHLSFMVSSAIAHTVCMHRPFEQR